MIFDRDLSNENIWSLKKFPNDLFKYVEDIILFALKFPLLDHIGEQFSLFEALNVLHASRFEHFKH